MYKTFIFDRARNCLKYLIKTFEIKEIFIPYYLCSVIRHSVFEEKCKPIFYHIDDNFMPSQNFSKNSFILYPNYFGICGENVKQLVSKYPNIIIDNAHAFYDKPQGFACFNSGIKFGYGTKALLWIKDFECRENLFVQNFPEKEKCRNRFLELHKIYSGINKLNISITQEKNLYPFCYPLLCSSEKEADSIVKRLKNNGMTIYRYWEPLPKSFNEYKFYSRLVPVPIAQTEKFTREAPNNIQQDNLSHQMDVQEI